MKTIPNFKNQKYNLIFILLFVLIHFGYAQILNSNSSCTLPLHVNLKDKLKARLICLTSKESLAGPQDVHNSDIFW